MNGSWKLVLFLAFATVGALIAFFCRREILILIKGPSGLAVRGGKA